MQNKIKVVAVDLTRWHIEIPVPKGVRFGYIWAGGRGALCLGGLFFGDGTRLKTRKRRRKLY